MILIPIVFLGMGVLLMKKPQIMTEMEILGFKPLNHVERLVKFIGFWFIIGSSIFLVVGIIVIIRDLIS